MDRPARQCSPASPKSVPALAKAQVTCPPRTSRQSLCLNFYIKKTTNPCPCSIFYVTIFIIGKVGLSGEIVLNALFAFAPLDHDNALLCAPDDFRSVMFPRRAGAGEDAPARGRLSD